MALKDESVQLEDDGLDSLRPARLKSTTMCPFIAVYWSGSFIEGEEGDASATGGLGQPRSKASMAATTTARRWGINAFAMLLLFPITVDTVIPSTLIYATPVMCMSRFSFTLCAIALSYMRISRTKELCRSILSLYIFSQVALGKRFFICGPFMEEVVYLE